MPGVSHSRVLSCARTDRETEHSVAKGRRSERERQQSGEEYCQYGEYRRIPWYEQFSSPSLSLSLSVSLHFPLSVFSYPSFSIIHPLCVIFYLFPSIVRQRSRYQSQRRMSISRTVYNDDDDDDDDDSVTPTIRLFDAASVAASSSSDSRGCLADFENYSIVSIFRVSIHIFFVFGINSRLAVLLN